MERGGREYLWPFNFRRGAECSYLLDSLGMNSWEFTSIIHWLVELEMEHVDVSGLLGEKWDVEDPTLFPRLLRKIAKREGCGNMLAEGMARLGERLGGIYQKFSNHTLNGYTNHALGTDFWSYLVYPYWVPVVLAQAVDVRDAVSDSAHTYTASSQFNMLMPGIRELMNHFAYDCQHAIGPDPSHRPIHGGDMTDEEFDDLAYTDGEYVVKRLQIRGVLTADGTFCEQSLQDQTGFDPTLFDPEFGWEAKVYNLVVGTDYTIQKMERLAERTLQIQRCYNIMEIGRSKAYDMSICDNIQPLGDTDTGKRVDPVRFEKLLSRFYTLMGWDSNGIPTEETLLSFGLTDCNEKMKAYREIRGGDGHKEI